MPKNRPFIDANATRGKPYYHKPSIKKGKIRIELYTHSRIILKIPGRKPAIVTYNDALKLAEWIKENCI